MEARNPKITGIFKTALTGWKFATFKEIHGTDSPGARQNVLESRGTIVDLYGIVTYVLFYAIFIPLPKSNYQEVLKYLQKQSMC